jgi:outer membrane receptor protein involved in Fe transport
MDFENLIISVNENGHPGLANGGKQRFKGEEIEVRYRLFPDLRATATYARHSSKFIDFIQDFDGTLTQLAGKRLGSTAVELDQQLGGTDAPTQLVQRIGTRLDLNNDHAET